MKDVGDEFGLLGEESVSSILDDFDAPLGPQHLQLGSPGNVDDSILLSPQDGAMDTL